MKDIDLNIEALNPKKAGPDGIPIKAIETATIQYLLPSCKYIYYYNKDLKNNKFSENTRTSLGRPIYPK